MRLRVTRLVVAGVAGLCGFTILSAQRPDAFTASRDHPAIAYSTRTVETRVTGLNQDLDSGRARLGFDTHAGYLPSLLAALKVPIESQLLVFSETSAQASLIGPATPRAIYFNDTIAVGWVRGGDVLEVAAHDAR